MANDTDTDRSRYMVGQAIDSLFRVFRGVNEGRWQDCAYFQCDVAWFLEKAYVCLPRRVYNSDVTLAFRS